MKRLKFLIKKSISFVTILLTPNVVLSKTIDKFSNSNNIRPSQYASSSSRRKKPTSVIGILQKMGY